MGTDASSDVDATADPATVTKGCWTCREEGDRFGFHQPSVRDDITDALCFCASHTYRSDYYDALNRCLSVDCPSLDVDACYDEALSQIEATVAAQRAIAACESRQWECDFVDCPFLAGFTDAVLSDFMGSNCINEAPCGRVKNCVNYVTGWCEVF